MTPRERILAILYRQRVDRLPVDIWLARRSANSCARHCGVTTDLAMFQYLNLDEIVGAFVDYCEHSVPITPSRTTHLQASR